MYSPALCSIRRRDNRRAAAYSIHKCPSSIPIKRRRHGIDSFHEKIVGMRAKKRTTKFMTCLRGRLEDRIGNRHAIRHPSHHAAPPAVFISRSRTILIAFATPALRIVNNAAWSKGLPSFSQASSIVAHIVFIARRSEAVSVNVSWPTSRIEVFMGGFGTALAEIEFM